MNIKNTFIVMSLGISLTYGMPSHLVEEIEKLECAIINLPSKVSEQQLLDTQKEFENCLKELNVLVQKDYDSEIENKILILKADLQFLKECKEVLLGQKDLNSKVAQKWINSGYTFECYLMHFHQ